MTPPPWSYSALTSLHSCGHAHHQVKVLKRFQDEKGEMALWGTFAHKQIEEFYQAKGANPWHENMLPYVPHIERAVAWAGVGPRYLEFKMGISKAIEPCKFFDEAVWGRAVLDYLVIQPDIGEAYVVDWKFGKVKPDILQMKLFALFVFYHFPRVVNVYTSFEWLQHNDQTRESFCRLDIPELWRVFLGALTEYKDAFITENFPKKPSGLCNGWCAVSDCQYWKPRR